MNKTQVKGSAREEKGKAKEVADEVSDDKSTGNKDEAEKQGQGGKGRAVLADVNDDPKRKTK